MSNWNEYVGIFYLLFNIYFLEIGYWKFDIFLLYSPSSSSLMKAVLIFLSKSVT